MPEYLRALVVILLIAAFTFAFAKKAIAPVILTERFNRWRNAWFAITLIAFLSHNFWIYIVAGGLLTTFIAKHEPNKIALFFILLFAVPSIGSGITGLGAVNYFFEINHLRLLSLVILFPTFISLLTSHNDLKFGKNLPDKFILVYLILTLSLEIRGTTLTDSLRQALYAFTDVFLPYYVASRALKQFDHLKEAISSFVLASFLVAAIGIFEFGKHWLLYSTLSNMWGIHSGIGNYLMRGNSLRALASLGQPIVFGYVLVVALGFYLFLGTLIKSKKIQRLGLVLLTLGLMVTLSRGPWVGAMALLATFIATGPHAIKRLVILSMAAIAAIPLISVMPGGGKIINLLPIIGNVEKSNIDYREKLLNNSIVVIKRNPLFGSVNYLETPEMQEMVQGEGIVDIVNTYLQVSLNYGLVGLSLFAGFFLVVLSGIHKSRKMISDKASELYLLGRSLTATIIAVLVIIFTVSSIVTIPIIYWSLAGMGVAYINIVRRTNDTPQHGLAV
jgi:O-antigen ligase